MTYWVVMATPVEDRLADLEHRLKGDDFSDLRPFGKALTLGLKGARSRPDGKAVWEEEDDCAPPWAQEREAVLDEHFTDIQVDAVGPGYGWRAISHLPMLFPAL